MAAHGKNIQLFLMDGDAAGRIKCTLANWTGVAFKIPRTELDKCKDRDDLKQSGKGGSASVEKWLHSYVFASYHVTRKMSTT